MVDIIEPPTRQLVADSELRGLNWGVRSVPLLMGIFLVAIANQFWFLSSESLVPSDSSFLQRLWPWMFLVGGLSSIALATWPRSRLLWAWSGGLVFFAIGSRGLTLLAGSVDNLENLTATQLRIFGLVWLMAAFLATVVWRWLLGPACEMLRDWRQEE